jgi:hypothetical protein
MFVRIKKTGDYEYVQLVESYRDGGRIRQRVHASLGRRDELEQSGKLDGILQSMGRLTEQTLVLSAHLRGETTTVRHARIGPPLVFERLWRETGCREAIEALLREREFSIPVERLIFAAVLHRIMVSGSDRACHHWLDAYQVTGVNERQLHQFYRAMAWIGQELPPVLQRGAVDFVPRCTKDRIEEALFARTRHLFSKLDVVFFDTTTLTFEGRGGVTIGRRGHNKDGHPELPQMVVGMVIDQQGEPICCEMWPGNTADVTTLVPIVDRLRQRFHIGTICIVADRGMIAKDAIAEIEARGWQYVLGARMRRTKEVLRNVLRRAGRYRDVDCEGTHRRAPLRVKEVRVGMRRYVVCLNPDRRLQDAQRRKAILASLRKSLRQGSVSLVGNKGFRRFLTPTTAKGFRLDPAKIRADARLDGKWVLRTNTDLSAHEVALRYHQLWTIEALFRTMKSALSTRPIHHRRDETIRGHVFCSFLAIKLLNELRRRLVAMNIPFEVQATLRDLDSLEQTTIEHQNRRFTLRSELRGHTGSILQALHISIPHPVRSHPSTGGD